MSSDTLSEAPTSLAKIDFNKDEGEFVLTPKMLTEIELENLRAFEHVLYQRAREFGVDVAIYEEMPTQNYIITWKRPARG